MAARGVFPANTKLRRLVDELRSDVSYSGAERKLAARCRRAGHVVRQNHPITDGTGAVVALADLCFPDQRLVVEVDGPSHWLPGAAARDRRRDRQLHDLGWRVLRFAVYEVDEDLDAVVAEVLRALASAAA
jgi:very-short-patch-repair endonuclease